MNADTDLQCFRIFKDFITHHLNSNNRNYQEQNYHNNNYSEENFDSENDFVVKNNAII